METQAPKVFVSHAHEDKERFVNTFAEKTDSEWSRCLGG
jgi:hypothetical protein